MGYDYLDIWQKAVNKEADETFVVHGNCISAFKQYVEGELMWVTIYNVFGNDPGGMLNPVGLVHAIFPEQDYNFWKANNQEIPFMNF